MYGKLMTGAVLAGVICVAPPAARAEEVPASHWTVDIETGDGRSYHNAGDVVLGEGHPTYQLRLVDYDAPVGDRAGYEDLRLGLTEGRPTSYRDHLNKTYVAGVKPGERDFDPFGLMTAFFGPVVQHEQATVDIGVSYIFLPQAIANDTVRLMVAVHHADLKSMARGDDGVEHPVMANDDVLETLTLTLGQHVELQEQSGRKISLVLLPPEVASAQ